MLTDHDIWGISRKSNLYVDLEDLYVFTCVFTFLDNMHIPWEFCAYVSIILLSFYKFVLLFWFPPVSFTCSHLRHVKLPSFNYTWL